MAEAEDRIAIRDGVERYLAAIDRADKLLLRSCFTEDARYDSAGGTLDMEGGDSIAAHLGGGRFAAPTHVCAHMTVSFEVDCARADTRRSPICDRHGTGRDDHGTRLALSRPLAQQAGEWRIAHRRHETCWQFDTTSAAPFVP